MKLYDFIKQTLEKYPKSRNSDKKLAWFIWQSQGKIRDGVMTLEGFMDATSYETIRRNRQKIVEHNPHLKPTSEVVRRKRRFAHQGQLYKDDIYIQQVIEAVVD